MHIINRIFLISMLALLGACASMSGLEKPRVSLADLQLKDANLFAQTFRVGLRVDNPNPFGVKLNAAEVNIDLDGRHFARGLSNQGIDLPGYGSSLVMVDVNTSMLGLAQQLLNLPTRQRLPYEISGTLHLSRGAGLAIPFRQKGELDWNMLGTNNTRPTQ